ncbi:MAG: ABC transporter permease [Sphingobacteriaceae bacterium]
MLKNYLKIAFRNLKKNPIISMVNILGLSIGMSIAFIIYFIVQYDFSFDKHHKDQDRVFRLIHHSYFGADLHASPGMPMPLAPAIKKEVTGIEKVIQIQKYKPAVLSINRDGAPKPLLVKQPKDFIFTDDSYFDVVKYQWLAGNAALLTKPNQIVLTAKSAKAYFPNTALYQIIGKEINFDDVNICTIAGIVQDLEENTVFDFQGFISLLTIPNNYNLQKTLNWERWRNSSENSQIIVKKLPNSSLKNIAKQLTILTKKHEEEGEDLRDSYSFQAINLIHLDNDYNSLNDKPTASKSILYSLIAIAIFLLLLAGFNFINLTTAQSIKRAKEIGVRKTMGGSRKQLILQFFLETFITTIIAALVAILSLPLFFQIFETYAPLPLNINLIFQWHFAIFLIISILIIGFLSGLYPALFLSKFDLVSILKGDIISSGYSHKTFLRKALITFQFIIAQVFLIATLIFIKQTQFLLNKDLGFNKEAIVYFSIPNIYRDSAANNKYAKQAEVLLKNLKQIPQIERISFSETPPSGGSSTTYLISHEVNHEEIKIPTTQIYADSNYLKIYNFKLLAGSLQIQNNDQYLINEALLKALGYKNPADAIAKTFDAGKILGVIADFNNMGLYTKPEPLMISPVIFQPQTFNIQLKPQLPNGNQWRDAIGQIQKEWSRSYPDKEFTLRFLDEAIARYYQQEQNMLKILYWITGISILISCLGLLAMAMYSINQRTKEIGIRKILGASLQHLSFILCKEFIVLIIVAFVIATPITVIIMNKYMQIYAYRTEISWWLFALTLLIMLILTMFTLSFKTLQTAKANPVKSLRTE